jgi:hypothetical protein
MYGIGEGRKMGYEQVMLQRDNIPPASSKLFLYQSFLTLSSIQISLFKKKHTPVLCH